ncbi:hypothetical protein BDW60DRAFT_214034 [Aspergillus nidulans var. acristatus]
MSAKLPLISLYKPTSEGLVSDAREFLKQPIAAKADIKGYSPFASECVRGRTEIPKESIYFFRDRAEPKHLKDPPHGLYHSVKSLHEGWTPIRLHLLKAVSQALGSDVPLMGTTLLNSATIGVHYYNSRNLPGFSTHFSPPHMDSGTLTILSYEGVGSEASFMPVPTLGDGRLLRHDRVRACVYRVRGPGPEGHNSFSVQRLSIAMICAPSVPSAPPAPPS